MRKSKWEVQRFEVDVIEGKLGIIWPVGRDGQIERDKREIVPVGKNGSLSFRV